MSIRRLRAPQQDRAVLAEPPLGDAAGLAAANRRLLDAAGLVILGRPLTDLRRQARQAAVTAAADYLRQAGEPVPKRADASLVLAGHQPELFHPGVWIKNFALHSLAAASAATPINLVVDNDAAKAPVLHLPALASVNAAWPHAQTLPFDRGEGDVPYEERYVRDEQLFAGLTGRARPAFAGWNFTPMLGAFWEEVDRQAGRTALLGERLVAARRTFERRWGCQNLELPVSRLCQTEPFAWFACDVLRDLPRFHAVYNSCVRAYRQAHGIRSRNHPVPDLVREAGWLEAPFWGWRAGAARRGRLLVRHGDAALDIRVGAERWPSLPLPGQMDALTLVKAWQDLEPHGFKVRSRALTTTLFARLFLADLFLHGIGGGKYDELTDEIVRRFYDVAPPRYMVLSATLRLPLPVHEVEPASCRDLARALRDLRSNPQRYLADGAARQLAKRKQSWIDQEPADAAARRERFQQLRQLTDALRPFVSQQEQAVAEELDRCHHLLQVNRVLQRRDYAFCLYPEALLRPFCTQFLEMSLVQKQGQAMAT